MGDPVPSLSPSSLWRYWIPILRSQVSSPSVVGRIGRLARFTQNKQGHGIKPQKNDARAGHTSLFRDSMNECKCIKKPPVGWCRAVGGYNTPEGAKYQHCITIPIANLSADQQYHNRAERVKSRR